VKGLLLLSGGIDSPVAGHTIQRQDAEVGAIHFSLMPFTDDAPERKAQEIARRLRFAELFVCRAGEEMARLAAEAEHRLYFVLSKRLMARVAEAVARANGYGFLITGESLGQVSSQTLVNLTTIQAAVSIPMMRPLLGFDKVEIVRQAEALGTFEVSKGPEFCDVLGPPKPATAVEAKTALAAEAALDYDGILASALSKVKLEWADGDRAGNR
jgi:thiamine biosynthesis protein ThiI